LRLNSDIGNLYRCNDSESIRVTVCQPTKTGGLVDELDRKVKEMQRLAFAGGG
jgi:hypothetical protein